MKVIEILRPLFKIDFFLIIFVFSILLIAYWPVISTDYLFHDDLYYFTGIHYKAWVLHHYCQDYSQKHSFVHTLARPLGAYLRCFYGDFIGTISDGKYLRLLSLVILTFYSFLVFHWLKWCKLNKIYSLLIAILIALLTSYQTPIAQITNAYHLYAAVLAVIALMLSSFAVEQQDKNTRNLKISLSISFILMAAALLIYPPAAMVYWAYLSAYVLFRLVDINKKQFINLFLISIPAFLALPIPKLWGLIFGFDERGEITHDITAKLTWFFKEAIPIALSYWQVFPSHYLMISSFAIFILMGFIALVSILQKKLGWKRVAIKFLICLSLLILAFLPNLLVAESAANHRIMIALKTILFLYVSFSLLTIIKYFSIRYEKILSSSVMLILLIWALPVTFFNMENYYAYPLNTEYQYLRSKLIPLQSKSSSNFPKILFVTADLPFLTPNKWGDEFGMPSTYWKDDVTPYIVILAKELNLNVDPDDIIGGKLLEVNPAKIEKTFDRNVIRQVTYLIDMNQIHQWIKSEKTSKP